MSQLLYVKWLQNVDSVVTFSLDGVAANVLRLFVLFGFDDVSA